MVKMPNLDDLKKMGTGLIDSAKSVKFGEMVDKLKSGMDSVSTKRSDIPQGDEGVKALFEGMRASLNELTDMQAAQASAIKKVQNQLSDLANVITASQKSAAVETTITPPVSQPVVEIKTTPPANQQPEDTNKP